jgi:agmatine deiminase
MADVPAALGFRWPAEWERHAATWLAWPHNPETWPGRLGRAQQGFARFVRELQPRETVRLLIADDVMEEEARRTLAAAGVDADGGVEFQRIPTDDAWLRDSGPIILVCERGGRRERALVDFRFDAWGGKYPPWDRDARVPAGVERCLALPRFEADFVLEGGSVDGNGAGAILTTESCLLHPNRGAGRTREGMERRLADWLGAQTVLWLGGGIAGDDTDGHVDDVARFVDTGSVVTACCDDEADASFAPLKENLRRLRVMRDPQGKPLSVATLPMPPPLVIEGLRCPASYANFYLANGCVLVPTFGVPTDQRALAVLRELFPVRDVVGVHCGDLVLGLGALHCLSLQEPA